MSAVRTERFGSFLKVDLEPIVAASLEKAVREARIDRILYTKADQNRYL